MHKPILEVAANKVPQRALIEAYKDGGKIDQWYDLNEDNIDNKHLIWLVVVLQKKYF